MADLDIRELDDPESDLGRQALDIYESSFPLEERDPLEDIIASIRRRTSQPPRTDHAGHFWIAVERNTVWGIAMFSYYRDTRMAFIPYIAIRADARRNGYGSTIFQRLVEQVAQDSAQLGDTRALGICFEVERAQDALDEAERMLRERRIRFYERNGAQIVSQVKWIAPPLGEGLPAVPFHLMFRSLDPRPGLSRSLVEAIVETVARHGYGLPPDDPYLQRALATLTFSTGSS